MVKSNQNKSVTIALDAMGGDFGVDIVVPGAELVRQAHPKLKFMIFGDQALIKPALEKYAALKAVSEIVHTDKAIANDDKPSVALRASKGSSMRMAIEAVKDGHAQAVVSAGNTGALMAMAKSVLKPIAGIHRPALASVLPTLTGQTVMLDLGANVLVDAENLTQFAVLGCVFAKAHKGVSKPSVGLLNVGTERTKGPEHVRAAAAILANVEIPGRYHGFVEGNDITKGTVDVVVSDGYAGNIALKTAEGVGSLMGQLLKGALTANPLSMLGGALAYFSLSKVKKKVDPRLYNGGVFSHGGADALGFSSAVKLAVELAEQDYVAKVSDEINHLMSQDSFLSPGM